MRISRKEDARLHGKGNSNFHGARPVHQIISMIEWIRTSRLSIKNSVSVRVYRDRRGLGGEQARGAGGAGDGQRGRQPYHVARRADPHLHQPPNIRRRAIVNQNPGRGVPLRYTTSWNRHFWRVLPLKSEILTFAIAPRLMLRG